MSKYHSLYGQMLYVENFNTAWKSVRANGGAKGVDGQTIGQFGEDSLGNLGKVWLECKSKTYKSQPVRRVYIDKASGGKRPLGIPSVRDRIVQQALRQVLEPIFDPRFQDCSFGFRPGRSAHMAIDRVSEYLESGYEWVVDADLKGYFDTIPHDKLIDRVAEVVADGSVLKLIRGFLKAGVMEDGKVVIADDGTPQGGVISPLLANIYLDPFDKRMVERGHKMVRYADDFVILCKSSRAAERVMADIKKYLEGELGLTLHPEKSKVVHLTEGFDFLGYHFLKAYGKPMRRPMDKKLDAFKDEVRELTRRNQTVSMEALLGKLNPYLRGWGHYFGYGNAVKRFKELDGWIRRRVRAVQLRSWRNVRPLHRLLKKKGWGPSGLLGLPMTKWRSSLCQMVHGALDLAWFEQIGLVSLSDLCRTRAS